MPLLADRFTVIVPGLRGCGESEKTAAGYEKENLAKDLHELLKHLAIDSIDLFGTDIGMMISFAYANLYTTSVRHLILAESLIPGFGLEDLMNPVTLRAFARKLPLLKFVSDNGLWRDNESRVHGTSVAGG